MRIRDYHPNDWEAIRKIHAAKGLPAACLPNLDNPLYFIKRVIERDGEVVAAAFVKATCEPFLLVDPEETPRDGIADIEALADVVEVSVRKYGMEDATCWVPTEAGKHFAHILEKLGFIKSPWPSYTKVLNYENQ